MSFDEISLIGCVIPLCCHINPLTRPIPRSLTRSHYIRNMTRLNSTPKPEYWVSTQPGIGVMGGKLWSRTSPSSAPTSASSSPSAPTASTSAPNDEDEGASSVARIVRRASEQWSRGTADAADATALGMSSIDVPDASADPVLVEADPVSGLPPPLARRKSKTVKEQLQEMKERDEAKAEARWVLRSLRSLLSPSLVRELISTPNPAASVTHQARSRQV